MLMNWSNWIIGLSTYVSYWVNKHNIAFSWWELWGQVILVYTKCTMSLPNLMYTLHKCYLFVVSEKSFMYTLHLKVVSITNMKKNYSNFSFSFPRLSPLLYFIGTFKFQDTDVFLWYEKSYVENFKILEKTLKGEHVNYYILNVWYN